MVCCRARCGVLSFVMVYSVPPFPLALHPQHAHAHTVTQTQIQTHQRQTDCTQKTHTHTHGHTQIRMGTRMRVYVVYAHGMNSIQMLYVRLIDRFSV